MINDGQGAEQYLAPHARVDHACEILVFLRVVAFREGEESLFAEPFQALVELMLGTCQHDGIVEIVHAELGHAAMQGVSLFGGQGVGEMVEIEDDVLAVVEPFDERTGGSAVGDGILALAVVVGAGVGGIYFVGTQDELWGELLVLALFDALGESQVDQRFLAEDV